MLLNSIVRTYLALNLSSDWTRDFHLRIWKFWDWDQCATLLEKRACGEASRGIENAIIYVETGVSRAPAFKYYISNIDNYMKKIYYKE